MSGYRDYEAEKIDKLEKEVKGLNNRLDELARHLNPDTCKPIYWDYRTAQDIIEFMKNLED
jgi:hypothetical protein